MKKYRFVFATVEIEAENADDAENDLLYKLVSGEISFICYGPSGSNIPKCEECGSYNETKGEKSCRFCLEEKE